MANAAPNGIPKSYRFTQKTVDRLAELAEHLFQSQTATIETCVGRVYRAEIGADSPRIGKGGDESEKKPKAKKPSGNPKNRPESS